LLGFLTLAYIGFYYFFQLDAVLNFNLSQYKILPLILPAIGVLPLLVWYADERSIGSKVGNALLVLIIMGCIGQQFIPGYSADSPRDMTLMYRHNVGDEEALLVLESVYDSPDSRFATSQGFTQTRFTDLAGRSSDLMAKQIAPIELGDVVLLNSSVQDADQSGSRKSHSLELEIPAGVRYLEFSVPEHVGLRRVMLNELLAYDLAQQSGHKFKSSWLRVNQPQEGPLRLDLELGNTNTTALQVTAWFDLPGELLYPYQADWPVDAQPVKLGPRALKYFSIPLAP
jgi:hypothetical protein